MMLGFSRTKLSPIAVDFGADSVKLLQILPTEPPQLVAAAAAVIPEHARFDAGARFAFLTEALKSLLKSQPFKGRRAMLSIPAFQTIVQNFEINVSEHESLDAQIGLHLQQRLNVDPGRMVVRHYGVNRGKTSSGKREVICIAAARDAVMRYIEVARRARLDVVGMHSEPVAILRAFGHVHRRAGDADRALCFIDIGAATTKVVISHGREMVFAKSIDAAGDQFTRQHAAARQISFADARAARIASAAGIEEQPAPAPALAKPGSGSAGLSTIDEPTLLRPRRGAVAAALAEEPTRDDEASEAPVRLGSARTRPSGEPRDDTMECLVDELQLCMRYYQSIFPEKLIEKLIFLGGEARHVSVCQAIARSVRTAAQLGDPFARLSNVHRPKKPAGVDLDQPQPGWAVPMGLCLSEANL